MPECPYCKRELEGPLPLEEEFYLCVPCRSTFQKGQNGKLYWIAPKVVITKGLSDVAKQLSELSPDPHQKRTLRKQAEQFDLLSQVVR